jgi:hypothetical protein
VTTADKPAKAAEKLLPASTLPLRPAWLRCVVAIARLRRPFDVHFPVKICPVSSDVTTAGGPGGADCPARQVWSITVPSRGSLTDLTSAGIANMRYRRQNS